MLCRPVSRLECDGLAIMRDGVVALAERAIGLGDAGVMRRNLVVRRDGLADQVDRLFRTAVLQRDHAEIVEAIELARVGLQDAAIKLLGLAQLTGLMTAERKLEQSVDPRRFG